jgi:hypothetical protein
VNILQLGIGRDSVFKAFCDGLSSTLARLEQQRYELLIRVPKQHVRCSQTASRRLDDAVQDAFCS